MSALSDLLYRLYTKSAVLFTLLLIDIMLLVRWFTRFNLKPHTRPITTTQYMKLIEDKNPSIRVSKEFKPEEHLECRVCLSEYVEGENVRRLQCKHTFHKDCLDKWLQEYWATCPLCRNKVLSDDVVSSYRRHRNQIDTYYDTNDEDIFFLLSALHGSGSLHRVF